MIGLCLSLIVSTSDAYVLTKTIEDRTNRHRVHLSQHQVKEIAKTVCKYSRKYRIHPARIMAVIENESRWRPLAQGRKGDKGLMQVRQPTVKEVFRKVIKGPYSDKKLRLKQIDDNVRIGTAYLYMLKKRFRRWPLVFTAYNRGPRAMLDDGSVPNLYSRRVLRRYRIIKRRLRHHFRKMRTRPRRPT